MTSTERARRFRAKMTPAQRTARNTYYAVKRRRDLITTLSPDCTCAVCGGRFKVDGLEIDHVNGRAWNIEDVSPSARVARYWKEYREGVELRVLCVHCSRTLGGGMRYNGARPRPHYKRRSAA